MPAKIAFDYDRAIDQATRLFWKNGYSNTSLRELLQTMAIGEGSFYNTLKSKKHLYLECLRHYNETVSRRRLDKLLAEKSVKDGIRAFFRTVLDDLDDVKTPRVCLLAGSLSGDVLAERELNRSVVTEMKAFSKTFVERLEAGERTGELPAGFDEEAVAQVIVTYLQGLFRVIRVLQNRAQMERQIELLLSGLGL